MEQVSGAAPDAPPADTPVETAPSEQPAETTTEPSTAPQTNAPPEADPRDAEIADLQRQLADAQAAKDIPATTATPVDAPANVEPDLDANVEPDLDDDPDLLDTGVPRSKFFDNVDAILRDPNVPGVVRALIGDIHEAVRYLENIDFHKDADGVTHVKPKEQA